VINGTRETTCGAAPTSRTRFARSAGTTAPTVATDEGEDADAEEDADQ
jgi:hypothetical protein